MKTKIFYLTRSYYPYQKGGGPLMRTGAVKYLKELGWDVTVVMPNYENQEFKTEDDIWQIPFKGKHIQKLASLFERVGIYEDYLDKWVAYAFEYLKDKITKEDIIFATSGGELGMIKLGSLLQDKIGCKFVVNFRDPLDYSLVHGLKLNSKFHIGREKQEKKYLKNSDMIITSSKSNQASLINKYPEFKDKIECNYFGYIKKLDISNDKNKKSNKLKIAYVGNMSYTQRPEVLYEAYKRVENKNFIIDISGEIGVGGESFLSICKNGKIILKEEFYLWMGNIQDFKIENRFCYFAVPIAGGTDGNFYIHYYCFDFKFEKIYLVEYKCNEVFYDCGFENDFPTFDDKETYNFMKTNMRIPVKDDNYFKLSD